MNIYLEYGEYIAYLKDVYNFVQLKSHRIIYY
jgi:hypothetical protein